MLDLEVVHAHLDLESLQASSKHELSSIYILQSEDIAPQEAEHNPFAVAPVGVLPNAC